MTTTEEKLTHPWKCDLSRGDTQCDHFTQNGPDGKSHHRCIWKLGHPLEIGHQTINGEDDSGLEWYDKAECDRRIAEFQKGMSFAAALRAYNQVKREAFMAHVRPDHRALAERKERRIAPSEVPDRMNSYEMRVLVPNYDNEALLAHVETTAGSIAHAVASGRVS